METINAILPILGLLAGTIIAYLTKEELKSGYKYFVLLQHLLLAITIAMIAQKIIYAIPIAIGLFLIQYFIKYKHPTITIPLLAIIAQIQTTQIPIFLYLIPTGTLHYKEHKKMILIMVCYVIISIVFNILVK